MDYLKVGQGLELHVSLDFLERDVINGSQILFLGREDDSHIPQSSAKLVVVDLLIIGFGHTRENLLGKFQLKVALFLVNLEGPVGFIFVPEDDETLTLKLAVRLSDAVHLFYLEEVLEQHFKEVVPNPSGDPMHFEAPFVHVFQVKLLLILRKVSPGVNFGPVQHVRSLQHKIPQILREGFNHCEGAKFCGSPRPKNTVFNFTNPSEHPMDIKLCSFVWKSADKYRKNPLVLILLRTILEAVFWCVFLARVAERLPFVFWGIISSEILEISCLLKISGLKLLNLVVRRPVRFFVMIERVVWHPTLA